MKKRFWEVARDLGIPSKQLSDIAKQNGLNIKNALCTIEPEQEEEIQKWATQLVIPTSKPEESSNTMPTSEELKEVTLPELEDQPLPDRKKSLSVEENQELSVKKPSGLQQEAKAESTAQASSPVEKNNQAELAVTAAPKSDKLSQPVAPKTIACDTVVATPTGQSPRTVEKSLKPAKDVITEPAKAVTTPAQPVNVKLTSTEPAKAVTTPAQPVNVKRTSTEPAKAVTIPAQPVNVKHPSTEPAKAVTANAGREDKFVSQSKRITLMHAPGKLVPKPSRKFEVIVPISVKNFSQLIGVSANLIIQKVLESPNKIRLTLNESLDENMVEWLGLEFGKEIQIKKDATEEEVILKDLQKQDNPADLVLRAPVVTFMGHVDHGKTSLLDKIRSANVAAQEAGGITQHLGAYKIERDNHSIVFLDTPGHEAFTAMRSRGAHITDIVVLVVAADDGVMPQTVEAISHAKAANVPIVVALNKIDKPTAKPEQVMQQLTKHGLIPEKWQGETGFFEVSALTGQGISELLDYLILMAEMLEIKYNPKRKASGVVLESKIVEGKGVVASLLVRNGTLKRGDNILCGTSFGRVKDIVNTFGSLLSQVDPSTPVEISGLSELPEAGDKFYVLDSFSMARTIADERKNKLRDKLLAKGVRRLTIEDIMKQIQNGETQELRIILKTDVHGSLEAITKKLEGLASNEVKIKVLHAAVGGINERDVQLSDASQAIILGFNVITNKMAREMAETKNTEIRYYSIIYQLLDDVKKMMQGLVLPESREEIIGHVTVRKVFHITKVGNIAGCYVTDGIIERASHIRISRDGVVINKEKPMAIASLKHLKEDVSKVRQGFECGIRLEGFDDIKEGDELEAFRLSSIQKPMTPVKS